MTAILVVYAVELAGDGMMLCQRYGLVPAHPTIISVFASPFLHSPSGLAHVGGNLLVLVLVGSRVEQAIGSETRATNPVLVVDPPLPAVPRRPRAVKDGDFRYILEERPGPLELVTLYGKSPALTAQARRGDGGDRRGTARTGLEDLISRPVSTPTERGVPGRRESLRLTNPVPCLHRVRTRV